MLRHTKPLIPTRIITTIPHHVVSRSFSMESRGKSRIEQEMRKKDEELLKKLRNTYHQQDRVIRDLENLQEDLEDHINERAKELRLKESLEKIRNDFVHPKDIVNKKN